MSNLSSKLGHISPKWDKPGTYKISFSTFWPIPIWCQSDAIWMANFTSLTRRAGRKQSWSKQTFIHRFHLSRWMCLLMYVYILQWIVSTSIVSSELCLLNCVYWIMSSELCKLNKWYLFHTYTCSHTHIIHTF